MTTITPAAWERMPWHPKARLLAELDLEEREVRSRIRSAREQLAEVKAMLTAFNSNAEVERTLAEARAYLARSTPDPDAHRHVAVLLQATGPAGQFQRKRRSREAAS